MGAILFYFNYKEAECIKVFVAQNNSCYLDDGTCLHDEQGFWSYVLGGGVVLVLMVVGFFFVIEIEEDLNKNIIFFL